MKSLKSLLVTIKTLFGYSSKKTLINNDSSDLIEVDVEEVQEEVVAQEQAEDKEQEKQNEIDSFGQFIKSIDFKIKANEEDIELEIDTDGFVPWISIDDPEIERLIDPNEIVISNSSINLYIDYPLNKPVTFELKTNSNGFTRKNLVEQISQKYHLIYLEEEETAETKTLSNEQRKILNRNQTDGKYEVWGHDITDLDLNGFDVYEDKNKKITIVLGIES